MLLEMFDNASPAVLDPKAFKQPVPGMPRVMVSCFASTTFERMLDGLHAVEVGESKSANMAYTVYKAEVEGIPLAFQMAAVGAPSCVANLEEVYAMGVETVILFGNCGVLRKEIADCSIIIPTAALRDEGTSYHYAPASDEIAVNPKYTQDFLDVLAAHGVSHTMGKCWTTDAFYRETRDKVAARREAGCVCVDMECSAAAAVAQFRGKEVFQFFYAADNLDAETWDERSLSKHSRLEEKDRVAKLAIELALRIASRKQEPMDQPGEGSPAAC